MTAQSFGRPSRQNEKRGRLLVQKVSGLVHQIAFDELRKQTVVHEFQLSGLVDPLGGGPQCTIRTQVVALPLKLTPLLRHLAEDAQ